MDDRKTFDPSYDGPTKREWVVYKFPIKGGNVLRAAMQTHLFYRPVVWSTIEGKIVS